jgi:hypothetical protein
VTTIDRRGRLGLALIGAGLLAASAGPAVAAEESCRASLGPSRAATLVARCVAVSPDPRPPCHASEPCAVIEAEIARGCDDLDEDAPDFCLAYRNR